MADGVKGPPTKVDKSAVGGGMITVRLPRSVHVRVVQRAKQERLSVNQLLLSWINSNLGVEVQQLTWGDLGKQAYEAYCNSTGWVSIVSGQKLPKWDDVADKIKAAWVNSAVALTTPTLKGWWAAYLLAAEPSSLEEIEQMELFTRAARMIPQSDKVATINALDYLKKHWQYKDLAHACFQGQTATNPVDPV